MATLSAQQLHDLTSQFNQQFGSAGSSNQTGTTQSQNAPRGKAMLDSLGIGDDGMMKTPSAWEKAANLVNKGYDAYSNLPGIKQAGELGGAIVGTAGKAIGGLVGGLGETGIQAANAIQGKGFDVNRIAQTAAETAKSTGEFGHDIGQAGTVAAPLGPIIEATGVPGAIAGGALAYGQGYQGVKDIGAGIKSGDAAQAIQGGLELGTGVLGAHGSIRGLSQPVISSIEKAKNARTLSNDFAQNKLEEAYTNALNIPKNTKIGMNQAEWGKNTPQVLAQERVPIHLDDTGKLDLGEGIEQLKHTYSEESKAVSELYKTSREFHSLDNAKNEAIALVKKDSAARGTDLPKNIAYIEKEFAALKKTYLDNGKGIKHGEDILVPTEVAAEIKSGSWGKAFDTKLPSKEDIASNKADYAIGDALRNDIQRKLTDENMQAATHRLGDLKEAIKILKEKNGASPRRIGVMKRAGADLVGGGIGAVAGSMLGPAGAAGGGILGAHIADTIVRQFSGRGANIALWSKVGDILGKTEGGEDLISKINSTLQERAKNKATQKLLPAPAIPLKGAPDTTKLYTQEEAMKKLRDLGFKGPLTEQERQNATPRLPAPAPQVPGSFPERSQPLQGEIVRGMKKQGYSGPLTKEEMLRAQEEAQKTDLNRPKY